MNFTLANLGCLYFLITVFYSSNDYCERYYGDDEVRKLARVNYFSLGMNGFVGHQSDGQRLYNLLSKKSNAKVIFLEIAKSEESTPEAKLYAACNLRDFNKKNDIFNEYLSMEVTVLRGDVLMNLTFNDVYSSIIKYGCD